MIPNRLKHIWSDGRATLNGWLSIGDPFTAEIMAAQGFDSLTVDLQHGFLDYTDAKGMLQAIRASGVTPLARAPWLEPGIIMKLLDAGAYGIICPMINTPDQAARLVDMVRYPPAGSRSHGPTRALYSAGADYARNANQQIIALAMIETAEAYDNVDAICATPGLDGIYIGPADLALGVTNGRLPPGSDRQEPEMIEAIGRVLAAARGAGIRAGLHCASSAYAARAIDWGFDMVTIGTDAAFLAGCAAAQLRETRDLIGADRASLSPAPPGS